VCSVKITPAAAASTVMGEARTVGWMRVSVVAESQERYSVGKLPLVVGLCTCE
jgi:hypothetical protein